MRGSLSIRLLGRKESLTLVIHTKPGAELALWGARRKMRMLEDALGMPVRLRLASE